MTATIGLVVCMLGIAVSGLLEPNADAAIRHAMRFDDTRGQMGFVLRSVQNRGVGITLVGIGLGLLTYAWVRRKW